MFFSILLAFFLAALRLDGATGIAFQATAHLFVGWQLGWWYNTGNKSPLWVALALSAVEVYCFFR